MRSPWDGESRAPLRVGLALIAAYALATAAFDVHDVAAGALAHPAAPRVLLALGRSSVGVGLVLAVGLYALFRFARRRAALREGLVALVALAILSEAIAALSRGPRREYFSLGAAFAGWLGGLAYARILDDDGVDRDEQLAEAGCVAGLAGTYVNAAISKLAANGLDWADMITLRAVVVTHHRVDDTSIFGAYARLVAEHPSASQVLLAFTLIVQGGAFLWLLSPALRAIWGTLLFGFHMNVLFLAHIGYPEARMLVLLLSFPWPRIVRRARALFGKAPAAAPAPGTALWHRQTRWATAVAVSFVALLLVLVWVLPVRPYTLLHGKHDPANTWRADKGFPPPPPRR
jgi:hypothetical protein